MSVDELREYGIERMDGEEIRGFLSSQGLGVLGLPAESGPYLLPISYGYDGENRLYFTYLVGSESRKTDLTESAGRASFLVYKADSAFSWESVLLSGTIEAVPEDEWDALEEILAGAWRPEVLASADLSGGVRVYAFEIDDQSGIRHTGLPPGFDRPEHGTE